MTNEKLNVLENGVAILENNIENEFETAQDILDNNCYTRDIDAESAYNERPENNFENSYKIKVERQTDFRQLERKIRIEKRHNLADREARKEVVMNAYRSDKLSVEDARNKLDAIDNERCECRVCSFELSYDEWKSGKMKNGRRLGKVMTKAGFSEELITFYSQQIKTEKEAFITVTSAVQFIAGMSYYNDGSWSSCQDTHDEDSHYPIHLGGSLHDDKLFVAFLHDEMNDLNDMDEKMMARVVMRYITVDGKPCLVPTSFYGNNENRDVLDNGLEQLKELDIYGSSARDGNYSKMVTIEEPSNGVFEMTKTDDIHICETIDEDVEIECPMCSGSGEYNVYSDKHEKYYDVECPMCSGSKVYEVNVYNDVDEWAEVTDESEVRPYNEGYSINDNCISIRVNESVIKESRGIRV